MNYEIYLSNKNKTKVYQLPIIPENLPELSKQIENQEFVTWWDGKYNFIEKPGLLEFTLECWLPGRGKNYNFAKSKASATEIIQMLEYARDNAENINIVITVSDGSMYVNDAFSIEAFSYKITMNNDYDYSLQVKKYRNADSEVAATAGADVASGWKQDGTGWWYVYDTSGSYYRDSWKEIDGDWYSFDFDGYARKSTWIQDNGYWYYLKDDCRMARNEWITLGGKSYYLGDQGGMYTNSYTPDGYWVGSDGAWIQ